MAIDSQFFKEIDKKHLDKMLFIQYNTFTKNQYLEGANIMYEMFRLEVLKKLDSFPSDVLAKVAKALDMTAEKHTISGVEANLCVVGRQEFIDIAGAYVVTKKTEGLADESLKHIARILRIFIYSTSKKIQEIQLNDIRAFLYL